MHSFREGGKEKEKEWGREKKDRQIDRQKLEGGLTLHPLKDCVSFIKLHM